MRSTTAIFFASVISFFNAASAIPVMNRQVAPTLEISFPTAGDAFQPGEITHVGWDPTPIPPGSNAQGKVILLKSKGFFGEKIATLARNFSLSQGIVPITIPPDTPPDVNYFIGLIDLSRNLDSDFTGLFEVDSPI